MMADDTPTPAPLSTSASREFLDLSWTKIDAVLFTLDAHVPALLAGVLSAVDYLAAHKAGTPLDVAGLVTAVASLLNGFRQRV